jgi:alkylation response protein AidB-like acyl-CoA dehydrogenase
MDFSITEDQQSLQALAKQILTERATHDHLKKLEALSNESGSWSIFDRDLWRKLAEAGITGIGLPESAGGEGLGFIEIGLVLEQVGRAVAPIPAAPTLVTSYVLGKYGVGTELLAGVADGSTLLTTAFETEGSAKRDGDQVVLTGEASFVPFGAEADVVVVPIGSGDDAAVVFVRKGAAGVTVTELQTTNREPQAALTFTDVRIDAADVVSGAADLVHDLRQHMTAGLAMEAAGVCAAALEMTAKYTSEREQFDKKIASFQAVGQRAADAYIDTEMVRLTALQATWRLSEGWPADEEVAVAKFWVGDGGMRALHACQHLHGGLGVDLDYPVHRYFVWGKQLEHELGTPTRQLLTLGAHLAATPV